jgi:thimet oligopeptidase
LTGYQAGYYGYMWSEVLALDMLSAYGDNLNNPQVGQRYRQTILSQGSQKPAAELVKDFLSRNNQLDNRPSNAQTAQETLLLVHNPKL